MSKKKNQNEDTIKNFKKAVDITCLIMYNKLDT